MKGVAIKPDTGNIYDAFNVECGFYDILNALTPSQHDHLVMAATKIFGIKGNNIHRLICITYALQMMAESIDPDADDLYVNHYKESVSAFVLNCLRQMPRKVAAVVRDDDPPTSKH